MRGAGTADLLANLTDLLRAKMEQFSMANDGRGNHTPMIRAASPEDAEWMAKMYDVEVPRRIFRGFGKSTADVFKSMIRLRQVELPLPEGTYRTPVLVSVIELSGYPAGFGILKAWVDEAVMNGLRLSETNLVHEVELWVLLIERKLRGHGLGSKLCSSLIQEAQRLGGRQVMARCSQQSPGMRQILVNHGFRAASQLTSSGVFRLNLCSPS